MMDVEIGLGGTVAICGDEVACGVGLMLTEHPKAARLKTSDQEKKHTLGTRNLRPNIEYYCLGARVRIKFTKFQRSVSERRDFQAGMAEPGKPFVIHS